MPSLRLRRLIAYAGLPALFFAIYPLALADASEVIRHFHSEIAIDADGSMTVSETIRVRAEGDQIRRGIFRDFPTRYRDSLGHQYVVSFKMLKAERDGLSEPFRTEALDNGVRVYLGDPDVYLNPAEYTYTLTYRTDRQLGFFDDHDELYWNVTGNGWIFPIDLATARVTLLEAVEPLHMQLEGYTGAQGAKDRNMSGRIERPGQASFQTTQPLDAYEGLTIVLSWPKGIVREPIAAEKLRYFLEDNWRLLAGVAGLLLTLIYYLWVWDRVGRDPAKGTIIPLFKPPEAFSPALVRYVRRMRFDHKAFTASVIQLAVKGHVAIQEEGGRYELSNKSGSTQALAPEEIQLRQVLFSQGSTIDLKQSNHSVIGRAVEAVESSLKQQAGKLYFDLNRGYAIFGVTLSLAVVCLAWSAGASLGAVLLAVTALAVNVLFFYLLKARTIAGRKVTDAIEGFRLYLSIAEKDRLNLLNPPEQTPELFERYLPYALALDVEQCWAEQFAKVFQALQERGQNYQPVWYTGSGWNSSRPARFGAAMGSGLSGAVSSASTPPGSSSGSGGGGSSGGGGGGGGGGGW